jgi:5-methylcytosine-specific restriction endonuclease McrA
VNYRNESIELAKKIAKKRDDYTCQRCLKKAPNVQIHGSHIIPVSARGVVVADPDDIIALCAGCHKMSSSSWHEAPLEQTWFHDKFPGRYDRLKKKHDNRPVKQWEWKKIYEDLKYIYNNLI